MNEHNEAELVKRAQQGDRESYGRLVDHHSGSVLAITYSRVGNFAASEDIAQDAFLMGFEKLASLRRPHLFGPWLRTIATNLCHRWHRTRTYRTRLQEDGVALRERLGYDGPADPGESLEREEQRTILHTALEHLAVREREALLLYYFEGTSVAQAAAAAGVTSVAMRKRLQRARDRLRDVLSAEVEAELNEASGRRKLSARVLAAIPFGASFGKMASLGSVTPSAPALAAKALLAKATGASLGAKVACGIVTAVLLAGMAVTTQMILRGQPIESAQETLPSETAPAASTLQPAAQTGGQAASGQDANALAASGAPAASISGTITTADGAPLEGAKVEIILRDPSADTLSMKRDVAGEALTSADGTYFITGLLTTEEKMLGYVTHPDWAVGGGLLDPLKAGEYRENINCTLSRPVSLSGRVVDDSGRSLPGASVVLLRTRHPGRAYNDPFRLSANRYGGVARAITDADGAFTLTHLPKGWILEELLASKKGYAPAYGYSQESITRSDSEMAAKGTSKWLPHNILPPCESITITLGRPGRVSGRVILATTSKPVADAEVVLSSRGGTVSRGWSGHDVMQTARTSRNGTYSFGNVREGEARVSATAEGLLSRAVSVPVNANKATRDVLVELALPSSIKGRVLDAKTERPMAEVHVQVEGEWCRSDKAGQYRVKNLMPGAVKLCVFSPWGLDSKRHAYVGGHTDNVTTVELLPGECLKKDLYCVKRKRDGRGIVTGRVVDARGKWVGGAIVSRGSSKSITDGQGRFRLEHQRPGTIELQAFDEASGTYGLTQVVIMAGQETAADIALTGKAASISGRFLDDKGDPVRLSGTLFITRQGVGTKVVTPDEDGRYSTGPMAPGDYWVHRNSTTCQGYACAPPDRQLRLEEGDTITDADFVLTRLGGVLAGSVVTSEGEPARHADLYAYGEQGSQRGQTDGNGQFRLTGVPEEGELLFRAGSLSNTSEWAQVGVEAGSEDLRVVLQKPGVLRGTCPKPEGILNASANAKGLNKGQGDHHFDLDGPFSFLLQPDTYTVTLRWETGQRVIEDIVVEAGEVTDLGELSLTEGHGTLSGNVIVEGRHPILELAHIEVSIASGNVRVDPGRYCIPAISPGEYVATAELVLADGTSLAASRSVEIAADAETEADFAFRLGASSISGTVAAPPRIDVAVALFEPGTCPLEADKKTSGRELTGLIGYAKLRPDKSFTLDHLAAGAYDIAAFQYNGVTCERIDLRSVTLTEGGSTTVDFDLRE